MTLLNADVAERARKIEHALLQRLAGMGQKSVAEALRVSESKISRLKGKGDISFGFIADVLAVLELKVVPVSLRCFRSEDIEPYIALARQRMLSLHSVDELAWEQEDVT